ncbi:MFS transporter [Aspergillus arachidicola]|uniref:MFS transporter n=1 Tax=Aspergillus arachidicola TaxID=656916 RepID=A0A2G7FLS4_9EURO|nr:MFS transporter [Aspergillus arachidicola]
MPTVHLGNAHMDDLDDEKAPSAENVEDCAIITTIDGIQVLGLRSEDADFYRNFSDRRKKLLRKARPNDRTN